MDLYGKSDRSVPQKVVILTSELALILISAAILFPRKVGIEIFSLEPGLASRRLVLFAFNVVVFLRLLLTFLVFLRRRIPLEEAISVPLAFALYFVGFALLGVGSQSAWNLLDDIGVFLFLLGSVLNSLAEFQRHAWKRDPANRGKLFTGGLFSLSMHVNYFGDLLWVLGYAFVTNNLYSFLIPLFLFCFFYFYNIPKLDAYLAGKYQQEFEEYRRKTKRFIPFIL
jgi:protein-S-isoprenylcysteine O-methyltransferase Ste14